MASERGAERIEMSPKNNDDFRKLDRAKDKIKCLKKRPRKNKWSEWAGDNPAHPDDSVDMDPQEWLDFNDNDDNHKEGAD